MCRTSIFTYLCVGPTCTLEEPYKQFRLHQICTQSLLHPHEPHSPSPTITTTHRLGLCRSCLPDPYLLDRASIREDTITLIVLPTFAESCALCCSILNLGPRVTDIAIDIAMQVEEHNVGAGFERGKILGAIILMAGCLIAEPVNVEVIARGLGVMGKGIEAAYVELLERRRLVVPVATLCHGGSMERLPEKFLCA